MSHRRPTRAGSMLELWRPTQHAGDAIGCLATTYTFQPALFDEQCLARFLDIESEPDREDLAYLLERESRLEGIYAGVLADYTQAGVEHSLRWDVLPVRIWAGKQHAKISLLVWERHVRLIITSANLTEPGYRSNQEVAASVDLTPDEADGELLDQALSFLRALLAFVPGSAERPPEIRRAAEFLDTVERRARAWKPPGRSRRVRHHLVATLPARGDAPARSALIEAIGAFYRRGRTPNKVWVASPFFDVGEKHSRVLSALFRVMARGIDRELRLCVPAVPSDEPSTTPRLAAPKTLWKTATGHSVVVTVEVLPDTDPDKNRRPWHAKMLALQSSRYFGLMIGSSNFTSAGMGTAQHRNAEANLLTLAERVAYGRETGELEAVWPETKPVIDPEKAEWLGAQPEQDEEEAAGAARMPAGFLFASYQAGEVRQIVLGLDPDHLPVTWSVQSCGLDGRELLSSVSWAESGRPSRAVIPWAPVQPPEKLLVRWTEGEASLPLNVEDSRALPPPAELERMTADDLLAILAASDPSAAFRAWSRRHHKSDVYDDELDSATPIDLDPLRRYDLQTTFLHRVRRRARVLAQMRANLQRPVWGRPALEWRLRGMVGIQALAERFVRDLAQANGAIDEALLTLADFLIVVREVDYQPQDGALSAAEFDRTFRSFLTDLARDLRGKVEGHRGQVSADLWEFWERVVKQCDA